ANRIELVAPTGTGLTTSGSGSTAFTAGNGIFFSTDAGQTITYGTDWTLNGNVTFTTSALAIGGNVNAGANLILIQAAGNGILTVNGNFASSSLNSSNPAANAINFVTNGSGTLKFMPNTPVMNGNVEIDTANLILSSFGTLGPSGTLNINALSGGGLTVSGG